MRPIIDEDKTLIYYSSRDPQVYYEYVDNLNALISYYEAINEKPSIGFATCTNDRKDPNEPTKVCRFDLSSLGPCNKANNYGYPDDKPCVILKLNRVGTSVFARQYCSDCCHSHDFLDLWLDARRH